MFRGERAIRRCVVFVSAFFAFNSAIANECRQRLSSLADFINQVERHLALRQEAGDLQLPAFRDFDEEIRASRTWAGIRPPQMIQDLLPEGVRLIDHSLIAANEPGLVKDHGSGEFLSIRVEAGAHGTNMGVLRQSLIDNDRRELKSLVRKDAKAVILFGHGGGTRTTGHHVAINLMNHFAPLGVDVVSFDQPWHAEGPRTHFKDAREYYEWLRGLIRKYLAPAGVPIIIAGHSMGGELADVYRRLYPGDDLVSGVISLSTVIDPTPGLSMEDRIRASEAHDAEIYSEKSPTPEDKILLEDLLKSGKTSITASFFEGVLNASNSWLVPPADRERLLPALYIWGEKDWLYIGNEAIVKEYLQSIPRTDVFVYGRRYDFDLKKDVDIGHMIFDHHRPGTQEIETFALIREFLENRIGLKLGIPKGGDADDLMKKIIQAYANILSFREFAKSVWISRRVANKEKIQAVNERLKDLEGQHDSEERKRLLELRKGFYLPEGPGGDLGRQWSDELAEVKQQELNLRKYRDSTLRVELEQMRKRQRHLEKELEAQSKMVTNSPLYELEQAEAEVFKAMKLKYDEINQLLGEYWIQRERGEMGHNPPLGLQKLISDFEKIQLNYQTTKQNLQRRLQDDALSGALGLSLRSIAVELWGEGRTYQGEEPSAGSLLWKIHKHQTKVDELEAEMSQYQDRYEWLLKNLVETYSNGLFSVETMTLAEILERPYSEWKDYRSFLQDSWARWQTLWKERPATSKASLY